MRLRASLNFLNIWRQFPRTYACFLSILLTYLGSALQIFGDQEGKVKGPYFLFAR